MRPEGNYLLFEDGAERRAGFAPRYPASEALDLLVRALDRRSDFFQAAQEARMDHRTARKGHALDLSLDVNTLTRTVRDLGDFVLQSDLHVDDGLKARLQALGELDTQ